jgi:hypothetical protein
MSDESAIDDWSGHESGPFCPRCPGWTSYWDCDAPCGSCEHPCCKHREECEDDGCGCEAWSEAEDEAVKEKR